MREYLAICIRRKMQTSETVTIERRVFTITEYDQMIKAGILMEDEPVELMSGEIVKKPTTTSRHAGMVSRLSNLLSIGLKNRGIVSVKNPIHLDPYSEPEPDVVVLKYRDDFYSESLPRPTDVLLLTEVADTSLSYDRHVKVPLYAKAGILEVWVVDVENEQIYVYRNPVRGKYQETFVVKRGETIALVAFPEVVLQVDEIL